MSLQMAQRNHHQRDLWDNSSSSNNNNNTGNSSGNTGNNSGIVDPFEDSHGSFRRQQYPDGALSFLSSMGMSESMAATASSMSMPAAAGSSASMMGSGAGTGNSHNGPSARPFPFRSPASPMMNVNPMNVASNSNSNSNGGSRGSGGGGGHHNNSLQQSGAPPTAFQSAMQQQILDHKKFLDATALSLSQFSTQPSRSAAASHGCFADSASSSFDMFRNQYNTAPSIIGDLNGARSRHLQQRSGSGGVGAGAGAGGGFGGYGQQQQQHQQQQRFSENQPLASSLHPRFDEDRLPPPRSLLSGGNIAAGLGGGIAGGAGMVNFLGTGGNNNGGGVGGGDSDHLEKGAAMNRSQASQDDSDVLHQSPAAGAVNSSFANHSNSNLLFGGESGARHSVGGGSSSKRGAMATVSSTTGGTTMGDIALGESTNSKGDSTADTDSLFDVNLPFPVKLHHILSKPHLYQHCITWLPHGRAWRILKPKVFEEQVIPKYYRSAKYASFMRQVNGWGFTRITEGPDLNAYYHEMFLRGLPNLCSKMRRPPKGKESTKKDNEGTPDFYKIDRMAPLPSSNTPIIGGSSNLSALPTLADLGGMIGGAMPSKASPSSSSMVRAWDPLLGASGKAGIGLGNSLSPFSTRSMRQHKPSIDVTTTAGGGAFGAPPPPTLDGSSSSHSTSRNNNNDSNSNDGNTNANDTISGADRNYLAHQNRILIQHAMRVEQQLAEADVVTNTRLQQQQQQQLQQSKK